MFMDFGWPVAADGARTGHMALLRTEPTQDAPAAVKWEGEPNGVGQPSL